MKTAVYPRRMTFARYDTGRIIAYLNETVIENHVPETMPGEKPAKPYTGYRYEGTEADGGTLIEVSDFDRDNLVNGVIRTRYSQTREDAVKSHQIALLLDPGHEKAEQYKSEWEEFDAWRFSAKEVVDRWLTD